MFVIAEGDIGALNAAIFFNEHVFRSVDHDVGDPVFLEKDFEGSEAEGFVEDFFYEPFAFGSIQEGVFGVAEMFDDDADFTAEGIAFQFGNAIKVEFFDEFAVNVGLERFKVGGSLPVGFTGSDHWELFAGQNRHLVETCGLSCAVSGSQPVGPYAAKRL